MEDDFIYFVEICDYEACWYTSVWDNEEDARKHYNEYEMNKRNHEQTKRFGKRKLNTTEFVGEYLI